MTNELEGFMTCDPIAGELRWVGTHGNARPGAVAGSKGANGYIYLGVKGKRYLAHRLVWLFARGCWPTGWLDHINGNRTDNRISNLREINCVENAQNRRTAAKRSKTGLLGVVPTPSGRYAAHIRFNKKNHYLGTFSTPEQAHDAYLTAKRANHHGCTI
jgi:hypothetical protein